MTIFPDRRSALWMAKTVDVPGEAGPALAARDGADRPLAVYQQLAEHYGDADSYRGLARAAAARGERDLAVSTLRDASLRLIRGGQRAEAIGLLEEAVILAPTDLLIHRRLAAACLNAGDRASAGCEHARFVGACVDAGDLERAITELDYARGTVGDSPDLGELERAIWSGAARRAAPRVAAAGHGASAPLAGVPREETVAPAGAEDRALTWIQRRDSRAGIECLCAARELLARDKLRAAADLLLAYVASGLPGRDVQRLLISLERTLGRPDIAAEKAELLARLLDLDGDVVAAGDVRKLAPAG